MQRLAGCLFQALDFVLHHQFPALQFDNLQVVGGEMDKSFVQLVLQDLVLTLELNEMRLHTHAKPPRSKIKPQLDPDRRLYTRPFGCRWGSKVAASISLIAVMNRDHGTGAMPRKGGT